MVKRNWNDLTNDERGAIVSGFIQDAFRLVKTMRNSGNANEAQNEPVSIFWYLMRNALNFDSKHNEYPKWFSLNRGWTAGYVAKYCNQYAGSIAWGKNWAAEPIFITVPDPTKPIAQESKTITSGSNLTLYALIAAAAITISILIFKNITNGN